MGFEAGKKYTIDEYLQMELASTDKHEYYQGDIIPTGMPKTPFDDVASERRHNTICTNLFVALNTEMKGSGNKVYDKNVQIYIEKHSISSCSDLVIITGDPITLNNDDTNLLNPAIAIEVLSSLTRTYDNGEKFSLYRDISTLREYILVDSDSVNVNSHFINDKGVWTFREYYDMQRVLTLNTIGISIPLTEIYASVRLTTC